MSEVLQYRFPDTRTEGDAGRRGPRPATHSGNLLIAAMTAVEGGDFEDGIRLMNRILAVRGQVVPVSPTPLTLHARLARRLGRRRPVADHADAPASIGSGSRPTRSEPSEDALAAIADAELIVLGPGSLYTSLLPSLLIPAIRDAVARAGAPRIFVCNVATQEGETTGFDLAAHVDALIAHTDAEPRRHRARQQPPAHLSPGSWVGTVRPKAVSLRWPPTSGPVPRLYPRRRRGPRRSASSRAGPAGRGDHPRIRGRGRDPTPDRRPDHEPERLRWPPDGPGASGGQGPA